MLASLRKSAQGFFAKLILIFLVGMFALWGVGDVFKSSGGGAGNVATVGRTAISAQKYQYALKRSGDNPQQALTGLINDLLIEKEEDAVGIVVSDDTVAAFIAGIPEFRGEGGGFDKERYQQVLAHSGKSERQLVEDLRHDIAGKLLLGSLGGSAQVPEELVRALYKAQEEQRKANIILLTPASAQAGAPSEEELKAYYDAHPKEFTVPEYRSLSYVALPIADVEAKIEASDEEITRIYEERKDEFRGPERRQVEDMEFDNEQDAQDAVHALKGGKTFAQVAKEAPLSNKGKTNLGLIAAEKLPEITAQEVFALKEGGTSSPVLANFRWHVYHVSKIEAGTGKTLQQAHSEIAREIAARSALDTAQKLMNGFDDALAGGATFEQAAEKIGQKVHVIGPITQDGNLASGKKASLPPYDTLLTVAFATPEKERSQSAQTKDGSYFVVRVDSISPAHARPLPEVKQQAAKGALMEKARIKLEKMAQDVSKNLRDGKRTDTQSVASGRIKRESETVSEGPLQGKKLSRALIGELFRLKPGESTHAYPTEDGNYMIATLASVTPAPEKPETATLEKIRNDLKATLAEETLQKYLGYMRSKYPVSINESAFKAFDEERE